MEIQNMETSDLLNTAVLIWPLLHLPCDLSLKRVSYSPLADFFGCYILHLEIATYYSKMTFCQKKIQRINLQCHCSLILNYMKILM